MAAAAQAINRLLSSFHTFSPRRRPTSSIPFLLFPSPLPTASIVHHAVSPLVPLHSSASNSMGDWTPPECVDNFNTLLEAALKLKCGDKHHWLVVMDLKDFQKMWSRNKFYDSYVKLLATVLGSDEEAEGKIYLVCEGCRGFGAEIDEETKYKLEDQPGVTTVLEDPRYESSYADFRVQSVPRLNDIFSYHHLSEHNSEWDSDHWLVHVKQPDGEIFVTEQQTVDFCIRILAEVVGSEEAAKENIYIVWCKWPFGFGVEIDENTSNKLKALSDVLIVLPDYAFDVKNKDRGFVVIPPSNFGQMHPLRSRYWNIPHLLSYHDGRGNAKQFELMAYLEDFEDSEDSEDSEDFEDSEGFGEILILSD